MFCKSCRLFDFKTSTRLFFCINRIFIHLKDRVNARDADCGVFFLYRGPHFRRYRGVFSVLTRMNSIDFSI